MAVAQLPYVTSLASDVSQEPDVNRLLQKLTADFPDLNMVINYARRALLYDITGPTAAAFDKAAGMHTNYLSVIRLNEKLLPILKNNPRPLL
jgi:uncharacterized oxidoreductase